MMYSTLFQGQTLYEWFQGVRSHAVRTIAGMSKDVLMGKSDEEITSELCETLKPEVPTLQIGGQTCDEPTSPAGSPSVMLVFRVPYQGNGAFFQRSPSNHPVLTEQIVVMPNELVITYKNVRRANVAEQYLTLESILKRISECLDLMRIEVERHFALLPQLVRETIGQRRRQFGEHDAFLERLQSIIPIKKRNDAQEQIIVPIQQKPLAIRPATPSPTNAQEWMIDMPAYEGILDVLSNMMNVVERSPSVFREMLEEDLRTILLVALNGIFKGKATGETFNGEGKTDILIREGGKNVFIAECLEWKGGEYLKGKMNDQLFRYATWRDCKLALIIFNRNKDFTSVIKKMEAVLSSHPRQIAKLPFSHESGCRYAFRRADDPDRHFVLTALAFDIAAGQT
jgi:hypothetical protein